MKLEKISLDFSRVKNKVYDLTDLTYLTASPFYGSGDVQLGGGFYGSGDVQLGGGKCLPRFNSDKDSEGIFKPVYSGLSYIDLPAMNIQAHCHEGEKGTTHFKTYDQIKIPLIDSYTFAIGDLYAESLGLKTGKDSKK